jgi:hypothetical protein
MRKVPTTIRYRLQLTKRLSRGVSNQTSYTWSKTLGIATGGTTRDPHNRNLDRGVLSFHRTHIVTSNGTYALPFGQNRTFLSGIPGWANQLVGQWQLGGLFRWSSGAPLTLTAGSLSNFTQASNNTPNVLGRKRDPPYGWTPADILGRTDSADH